MNEYKHLIYMNNAATSWPKPECVAKAVAAAITQPPGAANRGGIEDFNVFNAVRDNLAALMGVRTPECIALGCNSTWGLNAALFGYPLQPGDCILTTTAEHNAVLRPAHALRQRGIQVVFLPVDQYGAVSVRDWEQALQTYQPKLCVLNHASNVTGAVHDAKQFAALAKAYGAALLLDLSQTLGFIPVALEEWGVDMAAFTGHKYLLGPQGTGGLYVRPGIVLEPLLIGGTGIRSDLLTMPEEMPLHLEAGTGNEPSYYGLLRALEWAESHPVDRTSVMSRVERLRQGLRALGCHVIVPPGDVTPVVSFVIPGISNAEVGDILTGSYDVVCRTGLHCAPRIFEDIGYPGGTVRLSLSRFTTDKEIDTVLAAVQDITESI